MHPGHALDLPGAVPGPDDPAERTAELCAAIRRFAPFEPAGGARASPARRARASTRPRRGASLVEGLRQAAKVAAEYGLTLGMEPLHREIYGTWTTVGDIPDTIALMDEIGEPNVQLLYDVYHLHDTDDVLANTLK